jgi:hypothetical protein
MTILPLKRKPTVKKLFTSKFRIISLTRLEFRFPGEDVDTPVVPARPDGVVDAQEDHHVVLRVQLHHLNIRVVVLVLLVQLLQLQCCILYTYSYSI